MQASSRVRKQAAGGYRTGTKRQRRQQLKNSNAIGDLDIFFSLCIARKTQWEKYFKSSHINF